jgi:uncharacterized protein YmfQ (DUF2313 family)
MRKLGLKDAFALARIIKIAGIRDEIVSFGYEVRERQKVAEAAKNENGGKSETALELSAERAGFEFIITIITSIADERAEQLFYKLYADIKQDVTPEEVSLYDFETIKTDVSELVKKNDLKSFFRSASALMSKLQD